MRLVIKIGTNVLVNEQGKLLEKRFENIAEDIANLYKQGHEVALVTSGAVAAGRETAKTEKNITRKVLAVGQPVLMNLYDAHFKKHGLTIGQCLISRTDIANKEQYHNVVSIIKDFFGAKVVPVLNENDVFADESLNFGDNDSLAAMLAVAISADRLLLLTNQPGLMSGDPQEKNSKLIPVVTRVDKEVERLCSKNLSLSGRGGMIRKVKAAQQAVFAGITTVIADGRENGIIKKIMDGESIGTRFIACAIEDLSEQKRWLMAAKGFGQIIVDEGAAAALRRGKSLLFPGIVASKGFFEPHSIAEIACGGEIIAYGRVNFSQKKIQDALALKNKKQDAAAVIDKEVVHRNYMIILKS